MEAVFDAIRERWGRLDFVLHSIAYAPARDLHGGVADKTREGFARASRRLSRLDDAVRGGASRPILREKVGIRL